VTEQPCGQQNRAESPRFSAIVLAGGRGQRLGGASKPTLQLHGRSLLDRAVEAVAAADQIVIVGPAELKTASGTGPTRSSDHSGRVTVTREDPPFGGPVAGIAAGLAALDRANAAPTVVILAVDIPLAARLIPALVEALSNSTPEVEGVCYWRDDHPQWLISAFRRRSLARALQTVETRFGDSGSVHNASVRRLVTNLNLSYLEDDAGLSSDIDEWADLNRLESRLEP